MSLYAKAWIYAAWMVVCIATFPLWMPWLQAQWGELGMLLGMAFMLAQGFIALFAFNCPVCDVSLFRSSDKMLATTTPWPRKVCGKCGQHHDQAIKNK